MSLLRDSHTKRYLIEITIFLCLAIGAAGAGSWLLCSAAVTVMWGASIFYLRKREQLYKKCAETVERFEEGDFAEHLPKNQEGSFFALLSRIDRLAMTLKSKNETEMESRELINLRISDISHQLKTPLAALLMYNEIMEQEPENVEVIRDFNEKSQNALLRMQELIQTLLIMTRLDSGSITFQKEKYFICDIVRESVRDLLLRAQSEEKQIIVEGSGEDVIYCDKKWTMEAISNIVKNALEHTAPKGKIKIRWGKGNGVSRIIIEDNGTGIKSEEICHIFKRFYRSSESRNNGVGLGLPLAKTIVEEQGGTILLDSIWGEGTTMTISLLQEKS